MTLELNELITQIRAMGSSLHNQSAARDDAQDRARALLQHHSTALTELNERITRAMKVQHQQRFEWVGAAPTREPIAQTYPLPPQLPRVTVMASDGSQILPDQHAIALYYLVNIGSIVYRHGSNQKPETYNPPPQLCYQADALVDEQGRIIPTGEVNLKRDMAELAVLTELAARYTSLDEPRISLIDGQLPVRVIDLPYDRQQQAQQDYIQLLDKLRDHNALTAAYVDRPRSGFVTALLHLTTLDVADISEETLRQNEFRYLTDIDLFGTLLAPGERTAIFALKAKGLDSYTKAQHDIHFFYLNVGQANRPNLARVEIPVWVSADEAALNTLHATLVRQARLAGGYPYVLARAHELAIISPEEREALEMMLAVEMRKQGLNPLYSSKQTNKNLLGQREGFRL